MADARFWILDAANAENKIDAVRETTGLNIVALVDENAGGVVAYIADSKDQTEADEIARMLNFAYAGQRLSMEPQAVIEHFDGSTAGELLAEADKDKLDAACWEVVDDEGIYEAWHRACIYVFEEVTGQSYPPEPKED
jgi:hypothetical protein